MSARKAVIALTLALLVSSAAQAKRPSGPARIDSSLPVPEQLVKVESLLNHEDYSELPAAERAKVREAIAGIRQIMGERTVPSQLNPTERTEVFNHQEVINITMARAHEDSRLVCEQRRAIGSNRPTRVCMSVAERKRAREESEKAWMQGTHGQQPEPKL